MGKIDLDKFISSLIVHCKENRGPVSRWLEDSLADQCLRFDGDDLVEAVQTPKWYKCIKECRGFFVGRLYCTNEYGDLFTDPESEYKFGINISNPYYSGWFRPATEEEIEEISGNNGGISSNYELTEFEKSLECVLEEYIKFDKTCDDWNETDDFVRRKAEKLLDIARKQLKSDDDLAARMHLTSKAYSNGFEAGKAEALKDMPKWRYYNSGVTYLPDSYGIVYDNDSGGNFCCSIPMLCCGNYKISINELVEKLPKEEQL